MKSRGCESNKKIMKLIRNAWIWTDLFLGAILCLGGASGGDESLAVASFEKQNAARSVTVF